MAGVDRCLSHVVMCPVRSRRLFPPFCRDAPIPVLLLDHVSIP